MSAILLISIMIRLVVFGWAVTMSRRLRDWRPLVLAALFALMAAQQIIALSRAAGDAGQWAITWTQTNHDLPGLIISIAALLTMFILTRMFAPQPAASQPPTQHDSQSQAILNTAVDAMITIDQRGIIESFNPAAQRIFGYTADEVVSQNVSILMPPPDRDAHDRYIADYINTGHAKIIGIGREVKARRRDGSLFPAHLAVSEFTVEGRRRFVGVVRDLTDLKDAQQHRETYEQRLRSLTSQLALTEERQRREIATELHDQIGQHLAMTRIKLGQLLEAGVGTHFETPLDEVRTLIEQSIQTTRSLMFELGSPILYELGLEAAVESLAEDVQTRHQLHTFFADDGQPKPLNDDLRAVLFQSTRELLNNVVKHAHARRIRISVERANQHVRILVADDGRGFDLPDTGLHAARDGGFGLFNINERITHLGGQLQIDTQPGQGARITLTAPLAGAAEPRHGVV